MQTLWRADYKRRLWQSASGAAVLGLSAALLLAGCGGSDNHKADTTATPTATATATPTPMATATPTATITVSLTPTAVTLVTGGTQDFDASVANASNGVTWTIQEGSTGGTITSEGVYTAPVTPGTYHVVATSAANSASTATATVTVQSGSGVITVQ